MLKAGTAARRRSLRWPEPVDSHTLRAAVEQFLLVLDDKLQARDPAWVGHCKLLVTSEQSTAYASITAAGDHARWSGALTPASAAEMTIYLAIYGLTDADVAAVLDAAIAGEPIMVQAALP